MGGMWFRDKQPRLVQCPNTKCNHYTFSSGMNKPKCRKCLKTFWGDHNLFKTDDDRVKDRKTVYDLAEEIKKMKNEMREEYLQKDKAIDEILNKIEVQLTPY